jgi:hypothetical protein
MFLKWRLGPERSKGFLVGAVAVVRNRRHGPKNTRVDTTAYTTAVTMDDGARSNALGVHSAGVAPAPVQLPASRRAFASLRFDGVVPAEAEKLRVALAPLGASLEIINMKGGGDIDAAVIAGIEHCDTFVVFGSAKYGEDTGNSACTYYEYKHAVDRKKRIILLRMIPFDEDFEELQARVIFGANKLELPWMLGEPMPLEHPDKIAEAMGLPAVLPPAPAAPALARAPSRAPSRGPSRGPSRAPSP